MQATKTWNKIAKFSKTSQSFVFLSISCVLDVGIQDYLVYLTTENLQCSARLADAIIDVERLSCSDTM